MRGGIGWTTAGRPSLCNYQLPQPFPQLFQPLRQLFQLCHGPPQLPQGRPQPQLPQASRRSGEAFASLPAAAETASRIAASRSDTLSPCATDGCWPIGSWLAAPGATEPSNTATPSAPGVASLDTTVRY